jgi:hypothetical protein
LPGGIYHRAHAQTGKLANNILFDLRAVRHLPLLGTALTTP